jgi:hypothetical protein
MKRRDFIKGTAMGLGLAAASPKGFTSGKKQPRDARMVAAQVPHRGPGNLTMKWADEKLIRTAASIHPFDLQSRMSLAVNARTTCVDSDLGYLPYSLIVFQTIPAYMQHRVGDFADDNGRHTDSLWLNRSANDDRQNMEVMLKIARNAMDIVDDGLPWNPPQPPFLWPSYEKSGRYCHLPESTRVILGLVSYYAATGDPRALQTVRSMVERLYRIAEKNERYIWFPDYNYEQAGREILPMAILHGGKINAADPQTGAGKMGGNQPAAMNGMMLMPILRYYRITRDPIAAELAAKFSRLIVDLMPDFLVNMDHTHSSLATAIGIFMTGLILNIPEFIDWVERFYRALLKTDFILSFGWIPESVSRARKKDHLSCETCSVVDLLELSLLMARERDPQYWDVVERIAMNQLLEGQMLRADLAARIPRMMKAELPNWVQSLRDTGAEWRTSDHVIERFLGGFAIAAGPNDWVQTGLGSLTLQCCVGSGPRGLYDAWYYGAQEGQDAVQVNLQFSKRLPSAVVTSYMPGKAALDVEMTATKKLRVRKASWAPVEQIRILTNGQPSRPRLDGTYLDFGTVLTGTKVRMEFPNQVERSPQRIGEMEFHTTWRGNAVVKMEPEGSIYPLYQGRDRNDGVLPLPFTNSHPINPL